MAEEFISLGHTQTNLSSSANACKNQSDTLFIILSLQPAYFCIRLAVITPIPSSRIVVGSGISLGTGKSSLSGGVGGVGEPDGYFGDGDAGLTPPLPVSGLGD